MPRGLPAPGGTLLCCLLSSSLCGDREDGQERHIPGVSKAPLASAAWQLAPICGRHPNLAPSLVLMRISRGPRRGLPHRHFYHLLLPLVIHPSVSCYQGSLAWQQVLLSEDTGEKASSLAVFHSVPLIHGKITYALAKAKCWACKLLHSTPSFCSAFSFQFSLKLDNDRPAHLWYKKTPNW